MNNVGKHLTRILNKQTIWTKTQCCMDYSSSVVELLRVAHLFPICLDEGVLVFCFFLLFFGAISSFLGHLIKNKRIPVLWYGFKWFISFYVLIVNLLTRHYAEGDQKQWTRFQIHSPPHQRKLQRISPAEYNSRYALQRNLSSFASTTMKYFII